jgi:two-component system, OmpR family, phosphate regulon response regulator PhoB
MTASTQRSVLIVDDHSDTREGYAAFLRWAGYSPTEAASGEAALVSVQGAQPDLIVLDLRLQGMSGLSFLKELKASTATSAIPVILLTGSDVQDIQRGNPAVDCLLQKPVLPNDLVTSIEGVFRTSRRPRA